jgi:uncharacterized protein (DUF58 family)
MTQAARYLDPHAIAAIDSLELRARMIVEGMMTGMHRSPHQGVSVEFAQHRQYAAGDDLRHLDWKVFGRTDKLYLKQYQKETNLDLLLLVDVSGSMAYSSTGRRRRQADGPAWRKYDHAATLAACLAYLALHQLDRVGLVLFAEQVHRIIRPSNAREHWRSVVEALRSQRYVPAAEETGPNLLANEQLTHETNVSRLFEQLTAKQTRRSLVVLISDLFEDARALERGLAMLRHRRHDVIVMQVLDPAEADFPFRSPSEFIGLEHEGKLALDPSALRKAYLEVMGEHMERVEQISRGLGFDHLQLRTDEPLGAPLSHFLARRQASISKGGQRR